MIASDKPEAGEREGETMTECAIKADTVKGRLSPAPSHGDANGSETRTSAKLSRLKLRVERRERKSVGARRSWWAEEENGEGRLVRGGEDLVMLGEREAGKASARGETTGQAPPSRFLEKLQKQGESVGIQ